MATEALIMSRLDRPTDDRDRAKTIEEMNTQISQWSADSVETAFGLIRGIFEQDSPLDLRYLGFDFLRSNILRKDLSSDFRATCLRIAFNPVDPEGLLAQLNVLDAALLDSNVFLEEADRIFDYLIGCTNTQFHAKKAAREKLRIESRPSGRDLSVEEQGFNKLFTTLTSMVQIYPDVCKGSRSINAFNNILWVAEKAAETSTVENVCLFIKSSLQVANIPTEVLKRCVEDLCAIYSTTQRLQDLTWDCVLLLLQNYEGSEKRVKEAILSSISRPPQERASYTACGAIKMAKYMILRNDNPLRPKPTVDAFLEALSKADFSSRSVCKESMRTLNQLLVSETTRIEIADCTDWRLLFKIVEAAVATRHQRQSAPADSLTQASLGFEEAMQEQVRRFADSLLGFWSSCTVDKRSQTVNFLEQRQDKLPSDYIVRFLLDLQQKKLFNKENVDWRSNQRHLVDLFLIGKQLNRDIKCTVVKIIKDCVMEMCSENDIIFVHQLLLEILTDFQTHKTLQVGNALGELIITESRLPDAPLGNLKDSLDLVWPLLSVPDDPFMTTAEDFTSMVGKHSTNTVTVSLVQLFLQIINENQEKAVTIFNILVSIAQAQHLPSSSRLPSIRLLTRLRCNANGNLLVITDPDLQGLPAVVARTEKDNQQHASRSALFRDTEKTEPRSSRASATSSKSASTARSNPRSSTRLEKVNKAKAPMWIYPGGPALPIEPPNAPSSLLRVYSPPFEKTSTVHIGDWLVTAISIIQQPATDWEIYSYVLVHLPAQLSNRRMFLSSMPHVSMLRRIVVDQLLNGSVYEPPHDTGVRRGDVALCLFHSLTMLIGYSESIERKEQERIVHAFYQGINEWERTASFCIQALSICCHVLPSAMIPRLSAFLQKMSQVITQSHLTVDILEFLAGLARLPALYVNFREEEFRMVFAICVKYLEHSREQRTRLLTPADIASNVTGTQSESAAAIIPTSKPDLYEDLPQYVFALAYQVITAWFLSVKIGSRNDHVGWITRNLSWIDEAGNEIMEEQSQVTLDMMLRTTYLNLGETEPGSPFTDADGPVLSKTWLLGLSILTVETAAHTGVSRVTKRQASGTTFAIYRPQTRELPPHHEPMLEDGQGADPGIVIFPNHVLLQLTSSIAPIPGPMEPICLPDNDLVRKAISVFDRNDTVDGYRVGVIYVADSQRDEQSILSNTVGSPDFEKFLQGLGTKVALRGAKFNTQGLDRLSDLDGTHTYAWRDRITEVIFHVPTMMPTDIANDPQCINKKRHIGNDYVNIIWNESGSLFRFDTLRSQFNCVNIVVTPDAAYMPVFINEKPPKEHNAEELDSFYTVQMLTTNTFPDLSPIAECKLLPLRSLPLLIRQISLQASVFSNVWINRETGEHASSWRNRLREIKRMRERFANTGMSTSSKFPGAKSSKSYSQGDSFNGKVTMGGLTEYEEDLAASLDFSRWAGPNAPLSGA